MTDRQTDRQIGVERMGQENNNQEHTGVQCLVVYIVMTVILHSIDSGNCVREQRKLKHYRFSVNTYFV